MARTHSTSRSEIVKIASPLTKTQRRYKVRYSLKASEPNTPMIQLSGNWLHAAGFHTAQHFTVNICPDCLVLIPEPQELAQLKQQLEQVKEAFNKGILGD